MERVRGFLGLFIVLALLTVNTTLVNAEKISIDNSITIASKVAARHYIIVDQQSRIIQIDSNTTGMAEIRVYMHKMAIGNEVEVTKSITDQYHEIVPTRTTTHTGTVYLRSSYSIPLFSHKQTIAARYFTDKL